MIKNQNNCKKYSKQRELIAAFISGSRAHPTAEEIYLNIRAENPNLSLGTVYRNLNALCESGKVTKLTMPDGKDRFDGDTVEHSHLICGECGKIYDIKLSFLSDLAARVGETSGEYVSGYQLIINGICNECKKLKKINS